MSRVAVLGERARVEGYRLGGAVVLCAEDADEVHAVWSSLPEDIAVVVLTPAAARALGAAGSASQRPLLVVMPS
jgi:vacuolar-type H+-ATPase subunit F/Vma7